MLTKIYYALLILVTNSYNLLQKSVIMFSGTSRPVYISNDIIPSHRGLLSIAINRYNINSATGIIGAILLTQNKNAIHTINIEYNNENTELAFTNIAAHVYSNGQFIVDETYIRVNKKLYGETFICVILHELLHAQGLMHSSLPGLMNYSVKENNLGVIQESSPCYLSIDDISGLMAIKK